MVYGLWCMGFIRKPYTINHIPSTDRMTTPACSGVFLCPPLRLKKSAKTLVSNKKTAYICPGTTQKSFLPLATQIVRETALVDLIRPLLKQMFFIDMVSP
jgi:hypothetical protein